jgi:ion channel-forming bestrophin family protein
MLLDKPLPFRYIWNKIKADLFIVVIITIAVFYFMINFKHIIPPIPVALPGILGTAISLILSFKLSQSYERWWEARIVWGAIVNDSRSLVIQLKAFVKQGNDSIVQRVAYRQIAWCYSLGQSLRAQSAIANLEPFLSVEDMEALQRHTNKPLALLDMHAQDFAHLKQRDQLELFHHVQLDQTLVRLCESMGRAERINNTVFPTTYRVFLHFFIFLFITILSISLVDVEGIFEIPLVLVISIPFFLLEKTATHIQDPFSNRPTDISVTTIARNIEINIKQLMNDKRVPTPVPAEGFYVM